MFKIYPRENMYYGLALNIHSLHIYLIKPILAEYKYNLNWICLHNRFIVYRSILIRNNL